MENVFYVMGNVVFGLITVGILWSAGKEKISDYKRWKENKSVDSKNIRLDRLELLVRIMLDHFKLTLDERDHLRKLDKHGC